MIGLKEAIEARLDALIPRPNSPLFSGARYSVFAKSKRLRPVLTVLTGHMLGASTRTLLTPACALELIHTYSMIHDDLPCMDDDDFRRGKPSLHKATNEATAVLVGDYLLTHAFSALANAPYLKDSQRVDLVKVLSKHSGGDGMVLGQMMDIDAEGKKVSLKALEQIHKNKTAALITAAVQFGAIVAKADKKTYDTLSLFGSCFGLTFQIMDDILDVTDSKTKRGANASSDLKKSKSTYVSLLGLDKAKQQASSLMQKTIKTLEKLSYDTTLLDEITTTTFSSLLSH